MRFQSAGAYASLLLFSRVALGAAIGNPTNATLPLEDDDDTCDPDLPALEEETVTATVVPISSAVVPSATGIASNAQSPPAPIGNGTVPTPASEQLTTLTVLSTQVRTVISCAPTVTNCPADSSSLSDLASTAPEQVSTVLVTDVVQLATTICPVTAAESVSSSVISVAATGGISDIITLTASANLPGALPTDIPSPSASGTGPQPSEEAASSSTVSASVPSESAVVPPEPAAEVPSGSGVPPQESSSPETGAPSAPPAPTGAVPQPPSNSTGVKPFPIGNSSIPSVQEVTSTVYATNLYTVTSCAPSVTNCPAGSSIATEIVPISTTVVKSTLASSELASLSSVAAITGAPETTPAPGGEQTTLTVQVTHVHTVISCAPTVTNCPAATNTKEISSAISAHGSSAVQPVIVTSVVGETVTVCPVTEADAISSQVGASLSSAVVTTTVDGSASFFIPGASSVQTPVVTQTSVLTTVTPVVSYVTVTLSDGVESTSTTIVEQPQTVTTVVQQASASSSVAAVAESSSTAVIVSVSPIVSVITITLSDGFERTSTSSLQVSSTITKVVPVTPTPAAETPAAETPAAETPAAETVHTTILSTSIVRVPTVVTVTVSGIAQESSIVVESTSVHTSVVEPTPSAELVSNVVSTIYETVTSQIPIETVLTVTVGDQILTSTISTAAAVQTTEVSKPPQVSTVYVTVGAGTETSVMTSTFTASEVVAKETQTLTLTGHSGVVSTYTLTLSQATTVTQEAPRPTNLGDINSSACVPSTVTLVSVSTLCARSGNACATATDLPLARF